MLDNAIEHAIRRLFGRQYPAGEAALVAPSVDDQVARTNVQCIGFWMKLDGMIAEVENGRSSASAQERLDRRTEAVRIFGRVALGRSFYHRNLVPDQSTFEQRLQTVENRMEQAAERCRRELSDVRLVAVTKKFSAEHIRMAFAAGLREFGENYVQEFAEKSTQLDELPGARFHLIGHLQSNKVRLACELFQVVETIDSVKLLERLNAAARERDTTREVWLEVKLSEEQSKEGIEREGVPALVKAARACSHLRLAGLMTVPPWSENPEASRPYFQKLAALARENGLRELSMGMSNDFEVAIEEGATIIRVGTALFGSRPKPQKSSNQPA